PDNDAALHEIKLTAGVKEVRALAARPAAVRAAIAYHYRGERAAFQSLLRPAGMGLELLDNDPFQRRPANASPAQAPPQTPPPAASPSTPAPPSPAMPTHWTQQGPLPGPPGWQGPPPHAPGPPP